jgi:hypothetical protein
LLCHICSDSERGGDQLSDEFFESQSYEEKVENASFCPSIKSKPKTYGQYQNKSHYHHHRQASQKQKAAKDAHKKEQAAHSV